MGADHGRADVFAIRQILDVANVISGFEQMRGEGMLGEGTPIASAVLAGASG
jgi:hypothetical protein